MTDISTIISQIEKENSIFANKAALDSLLLPTKILGRESHMVELVRYLIGYRYGRMVPFVSVYGRSGSGKTTIVQHVCQELKEAEYILVNLRRAHTVFGATNLIIGDLGLETLKGSKGIIPFEKIGNAIEDRLTKNGKKLFVLVLDEFDVIFSDKRGRPSDFVYALIELEKDLAKKGLYLCIIGISNNVLSEYALDDRVKSRIGTSEVFFAPYYDKDVLDILSNRAKDAFADKIDDTVLQYCSTLASQDHGDARRAIDLLRVAAEIASAKNQTVATSHVDTASKELQKDRIENILGSSSYHFRRVLAAIARITYLSGQDWHYTSVIVKQYDKVWRDSAKPLTYRRVSEIIREIEGAGLLISQESSKGRHGYGKQYKLVISPHVVGKKIDASWWIGLMQAKEQHDNLTNEIEKGAARSEDQKNKVAQKQATERKQQHWKQYVWQESDE